MSHHRRYAQRENPYFTVSQCRHPNCTNQGERLTLPDGTPDGPLCLHHMTDAGYCYRCWNFVAGSDDESMERCGMCLDCEIEAEEDDRDFDEDYEGSDYPRDEYDEIEDAMGECGKSPSYAGCLNAGSEYCDFECPFRDEDFDDEDGGVL